MGTLVPEIPPVIPPVEDVDTTIHEVDEIEIRVTLEAWNLMVLNGLSDAIVANASTVEEIDAAVVFFMGHVEYVRLVERVRLILRRAEQLGILTDEDIDAATTTQEITNLLTALNGEADRDIYSAFFQGT